MGGNQDKSTYSAIFAILLIFVLIVAFAYNSAFQLYTDKQTELVDKIDVEHKIENIQPITIQENESILYENLTDEEADRIINEILYSERQNKEETEKLETKILK